MLRKRESEKAEKGKLDVGKCEWHVGNVGKGKVEMESRRSKLRNEWTTRGKTEGSYYYMHCKIIWFF